MEKIEIIRHIEAKFEDIYIHAHQIEIDKIRQLNEGILTDRITAYSGVWHSTVVNGLPENKNIVGRVYVILRNQGEDFNLALATTWEITVRAAGDTKSAATMCKFLQYVFDWMKLYVKEKQIVDDKGKPFIVPDFLYATSQFEQEFPD